MLGATRKHIDENSGGISYGRKGCNNNSVN